MTADRQARTECCLGVYLATAEFGGAPGHSELLAVTDRLDPVADEPRAPSRRDVVVGLDADVQGIGGGSQRALAQSRTTTPTLTGEQPGYLGVGSARDGLGITVSFWSTLRLPLQGSRSPGAPDPARVRAHGLVGRLSSACHYRHPSLRAPRSALTATVRLGLRGADGLAENRA